MIQSITDLFARTMRSKTMITFSICLISGVFASCGGKGGNETLPDDEPKPLTSVQIFVPHLQQEVGIKTLDVLISSADKNGVQRWCAATNATAVTDAGGKPVAGTFSILAVTGEQTDVYLFSNVRNELTAKDVFTDKLAGLSVDGLLKTLLHSDLKNLQKQGAPLPMCGSQKNLLLTSEKVNNLNVVLLHSIGWVSVQLDEGVVNLRLREFYAFYPATSGRIVAEASSLQSAPDGGYKVVDTSLPDGFSGGSEVDSVAIISDTDVTSINNICLYENKIWTPVGSDRFTTRFVVGGVYVDGNGNPDLESDNTTPKVTYYRIDIQSTTGLRPILRDNQSMLTVSEVQQSGAATPRLAAEGSVTINGSLKIKAINKDDWANGSMVDDKIEIN